MYMDVGLRVGARTTTIFRLTETDYDRWILCEITVGRVPVDFNILFQASRDFDWNGHCAIDDIDFSNCSLPGKPCAQWEVFQIQIFFF